MYVLLKYPTCYYLDLPILFSIVLTIRQLLGLAYHNYAILSNLKYYYSHFLTILGRPGKVSFIILELELTIDCFGWPEVHR